ncbi:MAG: MerR family transcriptional regulator [Ferruginibacter sp.]
MPLKQSTLDFQFVPGEETPESNTMVQEPIETKEPVESRIIDVDIVQQPEELVRRSPRGRMKLSDMNAIAGQIEVPDDAILFEKQYYSIGAVSEMFKVNQSLIRYWENEFDILKPKKNGKGDRFFRPEDVKNLKLIYQLLREKKYTIEGAKEFLKKNKNAEEKFAIIESLKRLKSFLLELKANL